ncbi:hypothetical protein BN12_4200002 [Nostocoides japonicum T1-X7]|uniref:Uncharacterized protein n=1 Tax=Nostocoides japonicum T1-X7 TaxID=1194083 RepID=A0A077LV38_9MICO|nr:hypothetical protein BN12_200047 [Tetrasphaera japonica T1-X7]CCH79384.1 hypothetical protein BN12_4200002 [Tetrasphaera japonica T1-X7]
MPDSRAPLAANGGLNGGSLGPAASGRLPMLVGKVVVVLTPASLPTSVAARHRGHGGLTRAA